MSSLSESQSPTDEAIKQLMCSYRVFEYFGKLVGCTLDLCGVLYQDQFYV